MGVKKKRNNKTGKALALVMLTMLAVGDVVPLFSYATDNPLKEVEELGEVIEGGNDGEGSQEVEDRPSEILPPEDNELQEDTIGNIPEEESEVNEIEPEGTGMEDMIELMENESDKEDREEATNIEQLSGMRSRAMVVSEDTNPEYDMATDADFSGTTNGTFRYIGTDDYVEIPHTIKGVNVTSYSSMFQGTKVKGVKSTNKNVRSMSYMFMDMDSESIDISQLDTSAVTSMVGMFYETTRGEYPLKAIIGMDKIDTSKVENMSSMFRNSKIPELDLSNFNTTSATSMASMFTSSNAKLLDVSSFNTEKVTNFGGMFSGTSAKDIIGEEGFDTSKATHMAEMFYSTTGVHELNLRNFDTSKVINMERMFYSASAKELDLSSFDTSNVTNMGNMFQNSKATTIKGLENFDTSKVTNMVAMFSNTHAQRLDLSSFDTSRITNMVSMFEGSLATYIDVSSFDTSKVTNMGRMFRNTKPEELDLSNFNTSRVTDMSHMFYANKTGDLDLGSFDTQRVTTMSEMFYDSGATTINVKSFDTTYVTDMVNMFRSTIFKDIDLSSFDMRSVNKTDSMFSGAKATTGVAKSKEDADKLNATTDKPNGLNFKAKYVLAKDDDFIGTVNGSFKYVGKEEYIEIPHTIRGVNVTSYKDMFENTKVKGVISTNTRVTDMSGMFRGNTSTELDVSSINTSRVVNMSSMFQGTKATNLDLRNFVTVNVVDMSQLFKDTSVSELDLGSFDLTKVTNTNSMLQGTKAVNGYIRTQEDLGKVVKSSNYPTSLKFTIWGIKVIQTPEGWTNGDVNLEVESYSGSEQLGETELVNNPGENILGKNHFDMYTINPYTEAKVTTTRNVSVPEWGVDDALRIQTVRGSGDFQFYWNMSNTSQWLGQKATHSVYIKNDGDTTFSFGHNGLTGGKRWDIPPGFSGRVESTGNFRTSHAFIQFTILGDGDIDAIFWGHKLELGDTATPWTPSLDSSNTDKGVYPVYSNGTYILRSTDSKGETRTVAHTVSNIDRGKPTAEVTKGTEGWTSQDVPLYITAKDPLSGVKRITLPDGKVVNADKAEYTAKENKEYTFKVEDNAGNETTVSTKVANIDRSRPNLKATVDNLEWTRNPINIKVESEASTSGLTDIKLKSSPWEGRNLVLGSDVYVTDKTPLENSVLKDFNQTTGDMIEILKGKTVTTSIEAEISNYQGGRLGYESEYITLPWESNYVIERAWIGESYKNATVGKPYKGRINYTRVVPDDLRVVYSRQIMNQLTGNPTFKIGRPKFEIGDKSTPWTPAPEDIPLINNSKTYPVVANGLYTFESTYNNGTTSEVSVNVTNIDLEAPTLKVEGNPEDYTEDDKITLNITASDNNQSGVKSITLPNGKVVNGNRATYPVTTNGEYKFTIEDNVGNKRTHVEKVDKLMLSYMFYIYDSDGKPLKGVGYELLRNGVVHATAESDDTGLVDFGKVPAEGAYTIKQVKVPDGYVVNPDEKDVDVGDTTEPEEFISYPRGKELPATGTGDSVIYPTLIGSIVAMWGYMQRRRKTQK